MLVIFLEQLAGVLLFLVPYNMILLIFHFDISIWGNIG
jgi:hypothetical protein